MGKYKKFLYFFIVVICFAFMPKVKAHNMAYWYDSAEITTPDKLFFYDITNNGYSYTEKSIDYMTIDYNEYGETEIMIPYVESAQIGSNGVMWWLENIQFKGNYLYQITFYVCASGNIDSVNYKINADTSVSNAILYYPEYYRQNKFEISDYITQDFSADMCKAYNSIFSSDDEDYAVGLRLWNSSTITTDLYLVGYKLEELGVYSQYLVDEITSVIDNSGYATATSVAQVQSSVDQVQREISAVDSSIQDQTAQQEQNHKETMDTITNSDSSDATGDAGNFFSGFQTDTFGLTSIITAPLNLIKSITSSTCSSMPLPIPFVDNMNLTLPCLRNIYQQHFGSFLSIYQTITFGIVAYWVCVRIFALVKDFKNPEHDEIEVLDL